MCATIPPIAGAGYPLTLPNSGAKGEYHAISASALTFALLETITHAETLIILEAGHSAYWEQPDIFNGAVLAFIQRVDLQARSEA
jgi:pimeloyl-ACP methyl ester carboxylesterase